MSLASFWARVDSFGLRPTKPAAPLVLAVMVAAVLLLLLLLLGSLGLFVVVVEPVNGAVVGAVVVETGRAAWEGASQDFV